MNKYLPTKDSLLMGAAILVLVIVGTSVLAMWVHLQCTRQGGFTLFHRSYTCRLVSSPTPKTPAPDGQLTAHIAPTHTRGIQ